uniref:Uncharacterized protein n=1 Tax=Oryza punctata TaxID=4537 RepID=A0A0E0M8K0_ORYPU
MPPDMRLPSRCRSVRLMHCPQSDDSLPVSLLPETSRLGCTPKASEMSPVKWFFSSRTRYSAVQFFRHGGSVPVKFAKPSQRWRGSSPENLLLVKLTCCKARPLPRSGGMVPLMWLSNTARYWRFLRAVMVAGSSPCRLLVLTSKLCNAVMLPISGGIVPVRLLKNNANFMSCLSLPSELGIGPVSELSDKSSCSRFSNSPISVGIEPLSLLVNRYRNCSFLALPSSGGILPVKELFCTWKDTSSGQLVNNTGGISPVRLFVAIPRSFMECIPANAGGKPPESWFKDSSR